MLSHVLYKPLNLIHAEHTEHAGRLKNDHASFRRWKTKALGKKRKLQTSVYSHAAPPHSHATRVVSVLFAFGTRLHHVRRICACSYKWARSGSLGFHTVDVREPWREGDASLVLHLCHGPVGKVRTCGHDGCASRPRQRSQREPWSRKEDDVQ